MQPPDRLLRNVSAEAGARVLYLATRFFIPPFVLARIGMEAYGLYGTVFMLVAYFGMSAIGFSNAYIKYVAAFAVTGQTQRANRLLSAGFTLMSGVGVAGFTTFVLAWEYVAGWMKVPAALQADAKLLAFVIVAVFFSYLAASVFRDALTGLQHIAAIQKIWIASFLIETALIFALVGAGMGLRGLAVAFAVRTVFDTGAQILLSRRVIPWLRVSFVKPDRDSIRLLLGFGGVVQINSMLSIFLNSVERAIATPLLGLSASGLLDLGKRFPAMATSIPSSFASSVLPSAADIHARALSESESRDQLRSLYLSTSRSMNAISGLLFGFLACAAAPCLVFWLGHIPGDAVGLTILFSVGSQIHLLTGPGTSILKAAGRPKMEFHYSLANCVALAVFVPLSRIVQGSWTTTGIALACTLSTAVSATWFLRQAHRELGVSTRDYCREVLIPGLLPYAAGILLLLPAAPWASAGSRLRAAAALAAIGPAYAVIAAVAFLRISGTQSEKSLVRKLALQWVETARTWLWSRRRTAEFEPNSVVEAATTR